MNWRKRAACLGMETNLFYTHPTKAQRICRGCPVRTECLEDALAVEVHLDKRSLTGVRGGKSPWQRQLILAKRKKAA
jgi:WhiB family redox-sensing transcriptional regulator